MHASVSADFIFAPHSRQPVLADEVQTFKALITVHKVLQEGHPITVREAQANVGWLESLTRGVAGDGIRGGSDITTPYAETLCRWNGLSGAEYYRLWAVASRIRSFPQGQVGFPQATPRIQWQATRTMLP